MKKILVLLMTLSMCISFCGCYDLSDVADMAYIIAIGIDPFEFGEFLYTFQFANSDISEKPKMYTSKADNLYAAMNEINGVFAQEYDFSQLRIVILSDKLKNKEFMEQINFFTENPHIHPDVSVGVTKEKANGFLESIGKGLDVFPTRYYEKVFNMEYTVYAPKTTIHEIEEYNFFVLPLISSSFQGMVICGKNGIISEMNGDEARTYHLLTSGVSNLKYNSKINGDEVVFSVSSRKPVKRENLKGKTRITVDVEFYCENLWNGNKVNENDIEKHIKNEFLNLLNKCSRKYDADIFGFSDEAKKYYLTMSDWHNEDWDGLFKKAEFDVNVKINIIRG